MSAEIITSLQNQRIKDAIKLRDHRQRSKQQRFTIDGARELLLAIRSEVRLVEVFLCPELCASSEAEQVRTELAGSNGLTTVVTPEVFEKLAYGERLEGVVAVAEIVRRSISQLKLPAGALVAVLDGIEKPGNVGAVLRSADAAGIAGVIVANPQTDLYNPNCIRASLGTIFALPVCQADTSETIEWLKERKCKIFAARVDTDRSYIDVDFRGDTAIVLGSEAAGLSEVWQATDVTSIKLPMRGSADSLNVSAAAAVLFYEAIRQRGL